MSTERRSEALRRHALTAVLCLLALTLSGQRQAAAPAAPTSAPEIDAPEGPTVALAIEAGSSDAPASVRIELFREGERTPVARHEGALPATLAAPRDIPLVLIAEAPGRARHVARLRVGAARTIRVPLPPGERLHGRVVDERGEPVADASIRLVREGDPAFPWTAATDAHGSFSVDTLIAGSYHVEASARGHAHRAEDGVETGAELALTLARVGLVSGRVMRPDGSAAAGATVVIAGSGLWPARQTDANEEGSFRLSEIPPGIYEVRAFAGDLAAEPRRGLTVEPGEPVFLTFALVEGVSLTGIVRDSARSTPIAGAQITVSTEALDVAPRAVTSGADGRFTVAGLRGGSVRVSAFADGYVPVSALEWDPARPLTLSLEPAATLEGVVLDEHRRPIEGATIEVLGETEDRLPVALDASSPFRAAVFAAQLEPVQALPGGPLPVVEGPVPPIPLAPEEGFLAPPAPDPLEVHAAPSYISDAEGRFRIGGVPPGRVQVVARHSGHAPVATPRIYVSSGAVRDDLELVLPPAGRLRGTVQDERADGVEGVLVEVRSDREPYPRVTFTDDRGAFELDDVFGELFVTATPQGRPAARTSVTVDSGEEAAVTLALEGELHALEGRVVDDHGYPIANAQLGLTSLRADAPFRRTFFSAADGTFTLTGLPAPPWRIEADDGSHASAQLDVVDESDVRIVLDPGASVSGRAIDDYTGDAVAASATLTREGLPAERITAHVDADGSFAFQRVRAGHWTLRIESDDHLPFEQAVDVVDRGRGPRDVTLDDARLVPAGSVAGTVVDALGAPVPRARVWLSGEPRGVSARTDAEGTFVLPGVAAGSVVVSASHPAAGEGESAAVRVMEGRESPGARIRLPERFDPERAEALPGRRTGVAVELESRGGIRVRDVIPGSRAERAGLRAGDVLETIDGAAPESAREAATLLRGPAGVPAILRVRRGDESAVIVVPRESWTPP